jgi:hypothetical protein
MPCSSGNENWWVKHEPSVPIGIQYRDHPHWETLTRLACDRCLELEARGNVIPPWAEDWWKEHKIKDKRERKESEKAKRYAQIRATALAKLTKEERDELGL